MLLRPPRTQFRTLLQCTEYWWVYPGTELIGVRILCVHCRMILWPLDHEYWTTHAYPVRLTTNADLENYRVCVCVQVIRLYIPSRLFISQTVNIELRWMLLGVILSRWLDHPYGTLCQVLSGTPFLYLLSSPDSKLTPFRLFREAFITLL